MTREPREFAALEARIGYVFTDRNLLSIALTHSSFGDGRRKTPDYERLEFLGDRVLGLLTAERLYKDGSSSEGSMARKLNALVRKETCADIARELDIASALLMSKSEEKQGGRDKTSILGDVCESLLAAIYLDGGMDAASAFYNAHWKGRITKALSHNGKDAKTALQEKVSAARLDPPVYTLESRSGPDHKPEFVVSVAVSGKGIGVGTGASKKIAQRKAAADLLKNWNTSI